MSGIFTLPMLLAFLAGIALASMVKGALASAKAKL